MKKKYKLKIEYPGSHPVGTISKLDYSRYPGVWEEITERDYEVLSFIYTTGEIVSLRGNGNYTLNTASDLEYPGCTLKEQLEDTGCYIYSIKRLSNGDVFTVGEEINFGDEGTHRIECFKEQSADNFWAYYNSSLSYGANIGQLKKALFRTKDGVDIFSKLKSYYLVTKDFVVAYCSLHSERDLEYNLFSTIEAADEYVKMNKPEFSRSQIIEMMSKITKEDEV